MNNAFTRLATTFGFVSRSRGARLALVALQLLVLLLAVQPEVPAQESGGAGEGGLIPPPAGTDVETLRKLLGLPSRAAEEAKPAPAVAPAPEKEAPAEAAEPAPVAAPKTAAKPAAKAKPVAKAPAKKPSKPVAKAPPKPSAKPAAPAPAEAEEAEDVEGIEEAGEAAEKAPPAAKASGGKVEQGSPDDIPPAGTVVSAANMERWKHLLGPSIQWAVSRGAALPVVDATPAPLEPFREESTRKYSSQVTLAPDKNSMRNYVAGIPFPLVTDDDPDVAIKMMFNFEGRIAVDDVAVRNFSCDTGRIPAKGGFEVERHYDIDAFRRIFYVNRHHVDPKPTWTTSEGIRYREMLGALQEPFDLKGAGFSYIRYLDPKRPDDSWLYFPQMKRVRRLSSAQRSEGVFGQDVDLDSYAGYAGNPAWSDWKYLGKKTVLGVMHARNLPAKFLGAPVEFIADDVWEPREVYILLAVSRLGGYNFGQRVIYLDRESLLIPYTEIYDLKGALWKSLVQTWSFGRKPIPTATKAVYDYEQFYIPSLSMMDIQTNHATRCQLPSPKVPGEEGWYYNFGDTEGTTEEVFSVSHFIQVGR
jgi:outer membrane biosynthesis protein TonB